MGGAKGNAHLFPFIPVEKVSQRRVCGRAALRYLFCQVINGTAGQDTASEEATVHFGLPGLPQIPEDLPALGARHCVLFHRGAYTTSGEMDQIPPPAILWLFSERGKDKGMD